MSTASEFDIFLVTVPGLESVLEAEVRAAGFRGSQCVKGGVLVRGGWPDVWRANLELRGASRVLARIASFRAVHLAQLDKRARRVPWHEVLRPDVPVRVEAACKGSRIYHAGAAAQRLEKAIQETLGAPIADDADLRVMVRIEDDLCTISLDTSGALLHKRGHKEAVSKAPLRETLAALFLRQAGFTGEEPVLDPLCGSGTFVIEAAEIALGLQPGRSRHFAFESLAVFDPAHRPRGREPGGATALRFYGSDRDPGAIRMARANAERAGVEEMVVFDQKTVSEVVPPEGKAGLVIANPPYGTRIGEKKKLQPLYQGLGHVLRSRFSGWRVALVVNDIHLAQATGLVFQPWGPPISHGGIPVTLVQARPLP